MFCTNCGREIGENINFCPYCGKAVEYAQNDDVMDGIISDYAEDEETLGNDGEMRSPKEDDDHDPNTDWDWGEESSWQEDDEPYSEDGSGIAWKGDRETSNNDEWKKYFKNGANEPFSRGLAIDRLRRPLKKLGSLRSVVLVAAALLAISAVNKVGDFIGSYQIARIFAGVDIFKDVEVSFEGVSPHVTASITKVPKSADYEFIISPSENLAEGDEVTVKAVCRETRNIYYKNQCFKDFGGIPRKEKKKYKVEDVPSYVENMKQIPQNLLEEMEQNGYDWINARAARDDADDWIICKYSDIQCVGHILLCPKQGAKEQSNRVLVVYKFKAKTYYSDFLDIFPEEYDGEAYTYIAYNGIVENPDGSVSYNKEYWTCEHSENGLRYAYSDYEQLYEESVTRNIDKFLFESDIDNM